MDLFSIRTRCWRRDFFCPPTPWQPGLCGSCCSPALLSKRVKSKRSDDAVAVGIQPRYVGAALPAAWWPSSASKVSQLRSWGSKGEGDHGRGVIVQNGGFL